LVSRWRGLRPRQIHSLLGIEVTCDRAVHTISLSQSAYVDSILSWFSLTDAKSYPTPMVPSTFYSKRDSPSSPSDIARMCKVPYREAIGSLMYAAVATRPDIAFAVSTLSRFLENPGEAHWQAVKRVFRYLAGTRNHALTYGAEQYDLTRYTDADGASQRYLRLHIPHRWGCSVLDVAQAGAGHTIHSGGGICRSYACCEGVHLAPSPHRRTVPLADHSDNPSLRQSGRAHACS